MLTVKFRLNMQADFDLPDNYTDEAALPALRLYCFKQLNMPIDMVKAISIESVTIKKEGKHG